MPALALILVVFAGVYVYVVFRLCRFMIRDMHRIDLEIAASKARTARIKAETERMRARQAARRAGA